MTSMRNQLSDTSAVADVALSTAMQLDPAARIENIAMVQAQIQARNRELLKQRYFQLCRAKSIGRAQVLDVLKQVYCFSFFFERLLTRRIAECSHDADARIMKLAREHLRDELGHVQLFQECLRVNGVSHQELSSLKPKTFTKAVFGYLLATVQHENEFVSNVAIMQVMESIGCHFFSATLKAMQANDMVADAIAQHSEDDAAHELLGLELLAFVNDQTMRDCSRIIDDLYRLVALMLDEWAGVETKRTTVPPRRRRTSRPPKAN